MPQFLNWLPDANGILHPSYCIVCIIIKTTEIVSYLHYSNYVHKLGIDQNTMQVEYTAETEGSKGFVEDQRKCSHYGELSNEIQKRTKKVRNFMDKWHRQNARASSVVAEMRQKVQLKARLAMKTQPGIKAFFAPKKQGSMMQN